MTQTYTLPEEPITDPAPTCQHDWQPDGGFETHEHGEVPHIHATCSKCGTRMWWTAWQWPLIQPRGDDARVVGMREAVEEAKRHLRFPEEYRKTEGEYCEDGASLRGCILSALDALNAADEPSNVPRPTPAPCDHDWVVPRMPGAHIYCSKCRADGGANDE